MVQLKAAGYKSFADIKQNLLVSNGQGGGHVDDLTALYIEVSLMLQADVFLAWGISEIDDVVEAERKKAGRSYCAGSASHTGASTVVVRLTSRHERIGMSNATWCSQQNPNTVIKERYVDGRRFVADKSFPPQYDSSKISVCFVFLTILVPLIYYSLQWALWIELTIRSSSQLFPLLCESATSVIARGYCSWQDWKEQARYMHAYIHIITPT